jgi:hypothetical protein
MRRFGGRAAAAGTLLFGLCYLGYGPEMSLQREYLLLLPVALSLCLQPRVGGSGLRWWSFGSLYGLVAIIKPPAALPGFLILGASVLARRAKSRDVLAYVTGFALAPGLAMIWLYWAGALGHLVEMAREYWPLYAHINGEHTVMNGGLRLHYLAWNLVRFGGNGAWLISATLGAYVALDSTRSEPAYRNDALQLMGLTAYFGLYPLAAGQFWDYHWLPFVYFAVQLSALCLSEQRPPTPVGQRRFLAAVLALVVLRNVQPPQEFLDQIRGRPLSAPKHGRPDEMARYLREHLRPGDTVQPLDWTGGAVHAMLLARAQPATPFLYDFVLYHHVSEPYIQRQRQRFITALDAANPRFVLQVYRDKPFVTGPGTTVSFPELDRRLASGYAVVLQGDGIRILERRP